MANKGLMGNNVAKESGGGVVERFSLKYGEPVDWWFVWIFASSTAKSTPVYYMSKHI